MDGSANNKNKGTAYPTSVAIFSSTVNPVLQVKSFKEVVTHSPERGEPSFTIINEFNSFANPLFVK